MQWKRQGGIALLLLAALTAGLFAWPGRTPRPLTMAECLGALENESGLARKSGPVTYNPPPPAIGVGSGPSDQTYYEVAQGLVAEANAHGIPLVNIATAGSVDNLAKAASSLNMAVVFAQSDALEAATSEQQRRLRVVTSLYREEIHILAWRVSASGRPLTALKDLDGLRLVVSERSGGSGYTARRLMTLARVVPAAGGLQLMPPTQALCRVAVGEADAMVIVSGQPVGQLRDLQRLAHHPAHPLDKLHFLPLGTADLQRGTASGMSTAFYEPARIERRSYPWAFATSDPAVGVDTLAVRSLLLAYDFSTRSTPVQRQKCAAVSSIAALLKDPQVTARLCQLPYHRKLCQLDVGDNVPGWRANTCL